MRLQTSPVPSGRHALVTGGGSGIGAAVAAALTRAGAVVTILGRRRETLAATVASGDAAEFVQADLTDPAALDAAIDSAETTRGPIAILINNAGAVESAPFARTDRAMWERMIAVNLTATYSTTYRLLPAMVGRGWGRVINIASTAGLVGYPYVAAYVAAKHGVVGLTRALALEVSKSSVTVNAVCPGFTDTDLVARSAETIAAKTGRDVAQAKAALAKSNPQGRLVAPEEVAAAVCFLCGPNSAAMNGQSLAVAGGEVM